MGFKMSLLQRRFVAFFIDCLVFYFIIFMPMLSSLLFFMGVETPGMSMVDNDNVMSAFSGALAIALPFFLFYKAGFEYSLSQTPGKRIMGLEVRGVPSFWKAVLRNLPFLFPLACLVDLFPMVFSDQRLFENISNTQVLNSMEGEK